MKSLLDNCRDVELAKFQSFLEREKASNIVSNIRTVQQLAYPIAGYAYVGPDTCLSSMLDASLNGSGRLSDGKRRYNLIPARLGTWLSIMRPHQRTSH